MFSLSSFPPSFPPLSPSFTVDPPDAVLVKVNLPPPSLPNVLVGRDVELLRDLFPLQNPCDSASPTELLLSRAARPSTSACLYFARGPLARFPFPTSTTVSVAYCPFLLLLRFPSSSWPTRFQMRVFRFLLHPGSSFRLLRHFRLAFFLSWVFCYEFVSNHPAECPVPKLEWPR